MKKRSDRHGAVSALCLVQFADVLGVTVVVTALPAMLSGVHAPVAAAGLLATGYAMAFGGLLLFGARLGDRFGHRRVLLLGLVGFGGASLLGAVAGSLAVLVAARCLQGVSAALSVPTALRLLLVVAPCGPVRRRALAAWSAAGAVAGASGLLLGGVVTDLAGWRAVLWAEVALAAILVAAVRARVPDPPPDGGGPLDFPGAGVLTAAVMAAVGGAALLERPASRALGGGLFVVAGALGWALVAIERRAREPLLPGAALRRRPLRDAMAAAALNTATTSSAATLATVYLQRADGASPTTAGLQLLPFSLCVVVGAALAGRLGDRYATRRLIGLGLGGIAAGDLSLLWVGALPPLLPCGFALAGLGIGLSSVASNALGTAVPERLQGVASGVLNTGAQLGAALGVSVCVLVATFGGASLAWGGAAAVALTGATVIAGVSDSWRGRARRARRPRGRGTPGPPRRALR